MASDTRFMLGTWTNAARDLAQGAFGDHQRDEVLANYYDINAKMLITTWGPDVNASLLSYSYRMWSGLTGDLYLSRWKLYLDMLEAATVSHKFDQDKYNVLMRIMTYDWAMDVDKRYPSTPTGDTVSIATELYNRYYK